MPEIKKGQSEADYVKKCIPYVIKKEGASPDHASAKCHGMYRQHKKKGTNYCDFDADIEELKGEEADRADAKRLNISYEEYVNKYKNKKSGANMEFEEGRQYDFPFIFSTTCESFTETDDGAEFEMVIVKGNSFMRGIYMSKEEIKRIHKGFENTPHDLNHRGTGYAAGFSLIPSDVSYVVGYQHGISYDESTGEVRAKVKINKNAYRYNEWKSYVDICKEMGRTPNVSMFVKGRIQYVAASVLPEDSNYRAYGYKKEDLVPCMKITQAVAVSTVFQGACSDKDGCGIKYDCNGSECNNEPKDSGSKANSEPIKDNQSELKRREYLENRMKILKGEK